ncbi:MAG: hypothetical protein HYW90_03095 [Candidatus Sungbacteria bacterium]|nr:hypothetical protein [Candidatus Sungbacteria bacterium]
MEGLPRQDQEKSTSAEGINATSFFNAKAIEQRIANLLSSIPQDQKVSALIIDISRLFSDLPQEKAARLGKIFEELQTRSTEDFVRDAATKLRAFVIENFTPQEIEERIRAVFIERGFIPLNRLLAYGIYKNEVHIHLLQDKIDDPGLIRQGLSELAHKLTSNPELQNIDKITATSWIVAKHPKLMERLGFTIEGPITEELKKEHFAGEARNVSRCSMTKEELLKRYG